MNQQRLRKELELLHTESFGWALHCCHHQSEMAKDILQTTYLKILEGKAKFKEQSALKTWLFSIIRNTAVDFLKKESQFQAFKAENTTFEQPNYLNEQKATPSFKNAIHQLSPKQSQILHLVFYQNLTIQEAAEVMDIQLGTARTHYERGKKQLKKILVNRNADWQSTK